MEEFLNQSFPGDVKFERNNNECSKEAAKDNIKNAGSRIWELGGVIPVLPDGNRPGYYPELFRTCRVRIGLTCWVIRVLPDYFVYNKNKAEDNLGLLELRKSRGNMGTQPVRF